MCGRYYIDSDMADEIEKVVHDIDQRIRQEHFAGDIFPTNVAPIIEKSEHGLKLMFASGDIHCHKERIWL